MLIFSLFLTVASLFHCYEKVIFFCALSALLAGTSLGLCCCLRILTEKCIYKLHNSETNYKLEGQEAKNGIEKEGMEYLVWCLFAFGLCLLD